MKSISLNRKRIVAPAVPSLGRAFAEAAVEAGASVVVADILEDVGRETVSDISKKGDAYFEGVDLGDPESIARLAQRSVNISGVMVSLIALQSPPGSAERWPTKSTSKPGTE